VELFPLDEMVRGPRVSGGFLLHHEQMGRENVVLLQDVQSSEGVLELQTLPLCLVFPLLVLHLRLDRGLG
jgi:hypothetical protein